MWSYTILCYSFLVYILNYRKYKGSTLPLAAHPTLSENRRKLIGGTTRVRKHILLSGFFLMTKIRKAHYQKQENKKNLSYFNTCV